MSSGIAAAASASPHDSIPPPPAPDEGSMGKSAHSCAFKSLEVPTGVPDDSSLPSPDLPSTPERQSCSYKDAVGQSEASGSMDVQQKLWVKVATRPWKAKSDSDLRPMLAVEEEALAAWIMGSIVLPSPPGFLSCTHTCVMRVAMLDFFRLTSKEVLLRLFLPRFECLASSPRGLYPSSY